MSRLQSRENNTANNETVKQITSFNQQDLLENFSTITANLKVGDIIQHTTNAYTSRTHVQTVYNVTSNDIIVAEHTPNSRTNSLKDYAQQNPTKMIVIIRIKNGD